MRREAAARLRTRVSAANVVIECGRNQLPDEREEDVFVPPVWTSEMFDSSGAKQLFLPQQA